MRLPPEVKTWLDQALAENNFSEYRFLSEQLAQRGYSISKSALQEYGKDFEDQLKALRLVTEQARAVVQVAPDEEGAVNDALVRLTQEKMFSILMTLKVDPAKVDLAKLARAVAELGKASVAQKRWQVEARKQALQDAASAAERVAKKTGLSAEAADELRREILGIAS